MILSKKHIGAKQHWKFNHTSEGNHPIFIIGQKCCSNTHVFPIWDNGWVQTNMSQSVGRYEEWTNPEGQISATIPGFAKSGILDFLWGIPICRFICIFIYCTFVYMEDSENIIMVQIGLQLFKWDHFHIFSLSNILTSDDLWPWYMTSDCMNIWRFPYFINKPSLVPIRLQLFKWGHFHIFSLWRHKN